MYELQMQLLISLDEGYTISIYQIRYIWDTIKLCHIKYQVLIRLSMSGTGKAVAMMSIYHELWVVHGMKDLNSFLIYI